MSDNLISSFSKFGSVRVVKKINDSCAVISIGDGFKSNGNKTFEFFGECTDAFPELPIVDTCITEDNFALVVLKK